MGGGNGYERWAKLHNLKQMAQTLIYLQGKGLDDYSVLKRKAEEATARFNEIMSRIKELESKLSSNAELQKQIIIYSKTRQVYIEYRKSGYSKKFREQNEAAIILHQAAKKYFDGLGLARLPTIASLRLEYAVMLEEKKTANSKYKSVKTEMRELLLAKANVDRLFSISDSGPAHGNERQSQLTE